MLAIEWTNKEIRVVEGQVTGESVKVSAAFVAAIPETVDPSDPETVAGIIRGQIAKYGLKDRRAVACIDRRNVVLKVVSVSNMSAGEIPNAVRLQAIRDLTLPPEETIVDYVRTSDQHDVEDPQVVVAVVRNEIVANFQRVFRSAGLKLEGIWPASLAHVRAAMSAIPTMITHAGEEHFLIVPTADSVELSLLRGTRFLTSASRPISRPSVKSADNEALLQVIRRLQASLSGQYSDVKIQSVLVAGTGDADLSRALTDQFGAEIIYFDPVRSLPPGAVAAEDRGSFAGVVGSLVLAERPADQRINFLVPKKPVPKTDYRRVAGIAGVGLAVLLGLAGQQYAARETAGLDKQISSAKSKRSQRDKDAKKLRVKVDQLEWVTQWQAQDVVWPNVLRDLVATFPEASQLFLTRVELERTSGGQGNAKAVIRLEGFADDSRTIVDLNGRLSESLGLDVDPGAIQPATQFAGYQWRYSARVTIPEDWQGGKKIGIPQAPPRNSTDRMSDTTSLRLNRAVPITPDLQDQPTRLTGETSTAPADRLTPLTPPEARP